MLERISGGGSLRSFHADRLSSSLFVAPLRPPFPCMVTRLARSLFPCLSSCCSFFLVCGVGCPFFFLILRTSSGTPLGGSSSTHRFSNFVEPSCLSNRITYMMLWQTDKQLIKHDSIHVSVVQLCTMELAISQKDTHRLHQFGLEMSLLFGHHQWICFAYGGWMDS